MKKFVSWVVWASEFDSPAAVVGYLTMLVAFVIGLALFVTTLTLVWGVVGIVLMWPYILGLIWRVQQFNAANDSWVALLGNLA